MKLALTSNFGINRNKKPSAGYLFCDCKLATQHQASSHEEREPCANIIVFIEAGFHCYFIC